MTPVWIMGYCVRCGKPFVVPSPAEPRYCSRTHQTADKDDRQRARRMGAEREPYSRWRIFERDGWRCQLCGEPVQRDAYYKEPDAATVITSSRCRRVGRMPRIICGRLTAPATAEGTRASRRRPQQTRRKPQGRDEKRRE